MYHGTYMELTRFSCSAPTTSNLVCMRCRLDVGQTVSSPSNTQCVKETNHRLIQNVYQTFSYRLTHIRILWMRRLIPFDDSPFLLTNPQLTFLKRTFDFSLYILRDILLYFSLVVRYMSHSLDASLPFDYSLFILMRMPLFGYFFNFRQY